MPLAATEMSIIRKSRTVSRTNSIEPPATYSTTLANNNNNNSVDLVARTRTERSVLLDQIIQPHRQGNEEGQTTLTLGNKTSLTLGNKTMTNMSNIRTSWQETSDNEMRSAEASSLQQG